MEDSLEMVGFLKANGTQSRFVSLVTDTPVVKMRKSSPFKGVRKVAKHSGLINANYNDSVRRRIAEKLGVDLNEVEYEGGDIWYKHLMTSDGKRLPLVVHATDDNGKHYLQVFLHKSTHKYVMPNGDTVTDAQLEPHLYAKSERPDFKPLVISVNLENVLQLKASGVIIEMPDFEVAEALLADPVEATD